jgi:hypothetical protein
LIQGSVQPPPGLKRVEWQAAFCAFATAERNILWMPFVAPANWNERVRELTLQKYSRREYNERR